MKTLLSFVIKIYAHLLAWYPCSYRDEFAEEMLLDFSDLAADAGKKGMGALMLFCLREGIDFPVNLLRAHSKEDSMTTVFRSGPARGALQGAFVLAVALIVMMTVVDWLLITMQGQGWLFLLRIANSHGWHLSYSSKAETIIYFSSFIVGAMLAGGLLALCFRETRRIKYYLLIGILGWVIPLVLVRSVGFLLKIDNESLHNAILDYSWIILAGLGFGIVFSLILRDHKKTPWLLLAGVLGYFIVTKLTLWILIPLFPTYAPGPFTWNDLAYIVCLYGITGIVIGAILGAVAGWSSSKIASA